MYGYPRDEAAAVAVETLTTSPTEVTQAILVAFDGATQATYERLLS